jgi:hypothetical protein
VLYFEAAGLILIQEGKQAVVGVLADARNIRCTVGQRRRITENAKQDRRIRRIALV